VTRAYRVPVPVFGGGPEAPEGWRARLARGRPNWWVILAVSLGLMALLVATAGTKAPATHRGDDPTQAAARIRAGSGAQHAAAGGAATSTTSTNAATTTTTAVLPPAAPSGAAGAPQAAAPSVTTTTLTPAPTTTTTTTDPSAAVAADRTQTQGYLNPPLQSSNQFGFTGAGAMEVSVVWSGNTYLTMEVSCPSGNQSVGGTSAMAASLPDASGNCLATVSEPTSESTPLTYTISIGPAGG
jgi:hypothetical protein